MADINRVTIIGRLTRDGELKYSNAGSAFLNISIANGYRRKRGDEWTEEVNYFDVVIFGKTAEALAQYLVKGKQIGVLGSLSQDRWEDRETGRNRSRVKVMAQSVQLLGGGERSDQNGGGRSEEGRPSGRPQSAAQTADGYDLDDDIPF